LYENNKVSRRRAKDQKLSSPLETKRGKGSQKNHAQGKKNLIMRKGGGIDLRRGRAQVAVFFTHKGEEVQGRSVSEKPEKRLYN